MKSIRISFNVPSLIVIVALVGLLVFQASARRTIMIPPSVVVTVNRSTVLLGLDERAKAQAKLLQMNTKFEAEMESRKLAIEALETQFKNTTNEAEKMKLQIEYEKQGLSYQGYVAFVAEQSDVERYLLYKSLYESIASAIELMAQAEGYDIVLVHDAEEELAPPNPELRVSRENQIKQQIATRRIMYASSTVDITEALILRMNNAHNAG